MPSFARLLYSFPWTRHIASAVQQQQRRIPIRHLIFVLAALISLTTIYLLFSPPPAHHLALPHEAPAHLAPPEEWRARAGQVKQAFVHAWRGYEMYALPRDELKPVTHGAVDSFTGWGVTLYDSLDTMLLMGLDNEFNRSLPFVEAANFTLPDDEYAPFFETVIRFLGGLLSAYALSNNSVLLTRADDLGRMLSPVFDNSSGLPYYGVNTVTNQSIGNDIGSLAELASCQMEYAYLGQASGRAEYLNAADKIVQTLAAANLSAHHGMAPIKWNVSSGRPADYHLSVGAQADSAHEYFLKQYLLTGKTDQQSLRLYIDMTNYVLTNLLYVSPTRHLLYVTDVRGNATHQQPTHILEHLSCFFPGLLVLGAHTLPLDDFPHPAAAEFSLRDLHAWAAEGLAQTCALTYADAATGLGPDVVYFTERGAERWVDALRRWKRGGARRSPPGLGPKPPVVYDAEEKLHGPRKDHVRDYWTRNTAYLLRPETVESLYLMWRFTGDEIWRQRGWDIFQAIELHTKTPSGYASLRHVDVIPAPKIDSMPSYFLAETLKYLYLLFVDDDPIPLDKWVFNTEAHPFPVFNPVLTTPSS